VPGPDRTRKEDEVLDIYIDADACPVKQEICKVARRYHLNVTFVSNSWMRMAEQEGVKLVVVGDQFDAADQWIVEHISRDDIVVTADIPLASLCVKGGARVLAPSGHPFSVANVGAALATRDLMKDLRAEGLVSGGPPPFAARDRSRFLERLDQLIQQIKRVQ
jgi:uncharacterized protein YaiI (UPF0178 family)